MLKNQDYKENDKLMWLFTEKLGKISIIVHGARKAKSKFLPLTLPFCYGDYVLFKGKSMYSLNEGEIIESFQVLLNDLDTLTYASYINELIDISMTEEESNRELFKDCIIMYYLMKNSVGNIENLIRAFEIKLLGHTGYGLNLENCCGCGKKLSKSNYISIQYYGGICDSCNKDSSFRISTAAFNILKYLTRIPLENVHRISITNEIQMELENLLNQLIIQSFSRKPNSLDLIKLLRSDKNE